MTTAKAKKAKGARRARYAGKQIKALVASAKATTLRAGSNRARMLDFVLKHKSTDDVLGKGPAGIKIRGDNLAGMIRRKHIALVG
jgi:hypothetical protein